MAKSLPTRRKKSLDTGTTVLRLRAMGYALCTAAGLLMTACAMPGPPADTRGWQLLAEDNASYQTHRPWWLLLNNPQLNRWMESAFQANARVISAHAALTRAMARRDAVAAENASGTRRTSLAKNDELPATGKTTQRTDLGGSMEMDLHGVRQNTLQVASAEVDVHAAQLEESQAVVATEWVTALIDTQAAQARLAATQLQLDRLGSMQEVLRQLKNAPGSSSRITTALDSARNDLVQAQYQFDSRMAALQELAGPDLKLSDAEVLLKTSIPREPDLAPSATAVVPRAVRQAQKELQLAQAKLAQASTLSAPLFQLGGSMGIQYVLSEDRPRATAELQGVSVGVDIPLVDPAVASARLLRSREQVQAAESHLTSVIARQQQEITRAQQEHQEAQRKLDALQAASERASRKAESDGRNIARNAGARLPGAIAAQHEALLAQWAVTDAKAALQKLRIRYYALTN